MNASTRDKISAAQRQNWASRRAADEQLSALQESHKRVLKTLDLCAAFVNFKAEEHGDPLAKFLKQRVDAGFDALKAENIAASTLIAETTPNPEAGSATGL